MAALTLNIPLGTFLVLVFLIMELLITPIKSLFKNELLYSSARHKIIRGGAVRVRTMPKIFHALEFERLITSSGLLIWAVNALRVGTAIFLIVTITLWERTVQQNVNPVATSVRTTSVDAFAVAGGRTILLSPFPVTGLSLDGVRNLAPFSENGTGSDAPYRVRENALMSAEYASKCVIPNENETIVYFGAIIRNHMGNTETMCLDGTGDSSQVVAASFKTVQSRGAGRDLKSITLQTALSTDGVSTVYTAKITDEADVKLAGYVSFTQRSHWNANVRRSFYGLFRGGDEEIWRLSLELASTSTNIPCYGSEGLETGTWLFGEDSITCPSGETEPRSFANGGIPTKPLQQAGLNIFAAEDNGERNSDILAWLIETDYARFFAKRTFSEELNERVRGVRMFYSAYDDQVLQVKDGSTAESVSVGRAETVVLFVAIGLLLAQILVGVCWGFFQRRKYKIKSEVVSYEALAAMYNAEATGSRIDDGDRTSFKLGLQNKEAGAQSLGILRGDQGFARHSETFLHYHGWQGKYDSDTFPEPS